MDGWVGLQASVSVLVRLEVLVVQLLLGFVELAELLGLALAQLLPVSVVSGETLEAQRRSPLVRSTHGRGPQPEPLTAGSNWEYLSVSARNISEAEIFILASFAT